MGEGEGGRNNEAIIKYMGEGRQKRIYIYSMERGEMRKMMVVRYAMHLLLY